MEGSRRSVFAMLTVWAAAGCAGLSLARFVRRPPPAASRRRVRFTEEEDAVVLITPRCRAGDSGGEEHQHADKESGGGDQQVRALKLALAAADDEERKLRASKSVAGTPDLPHQRLPPLLPQRESALGASLAHLPILRLDGTRVASSEIQPKVVALYFSGHWCPPCRQFTPLLKSFYEEVHSNEVNVRMNLVPSLGLEVVFVSSDHSPEEMMNYMKEAHGEWLRLDYRERKAQRALCVRFEVRTIPALVVVTWPDGEVLSRNGRQEVADLDSAKCLQTWIDSKRRADCKREALRRRSVLRGAAPTGASG